MWIPSDEKEPILYHAPTRKSAGYFGAVRLRDGKLVCQREENRFNGETYAAFLRKLHGVACRSGRQAVVLADNVRYHHARLHEAWRREHRRTLRCLFLPAYSPDLNPIERVWKITRRLCVHNRYFPQLRDLLRAVDEQFVLWRSPNTTLAKLCSL